MKAIQTLKELFQNADYSLLNTLQINPLCKENGEDYYPREVLSGHYVKVKPTPLRDPEYIAHSKIFFKELGLSDSLAISEDFMKMFSGDSEYLDGNTGKLGWATGYALSIYGTEYYDQCPFRTGNGYGDGRAISIYEGVLNNKRWEMQLKGGGKTPYCRGADGRAVLRSSIREFLAQEHMYALGVPTSRSLSLYVSKSESVKRPWFENNSRSYDPEVMIAEAVAITTRVAPSFLRVGQIELFGRRTRKNEHPEAIKELTQIVLHTIDRHYSDEIDIDLSFEEKVILLAQSFQKRLISLVANWIRIGYCQGNFNSDNCAVGGYTLDYGPFGFIDMFNPQYQPWTGGGVHFSFFNQTRAAQMNFHMFCVALSPLLDSNVEKLKQLDEINDQFVTNMKKKMGKMWASKLGIKCFDEVLFNELISLMIETKVDYIIFFRELSNIPQNIEELEKSFYIQSLNNEDLKMRWSQWLERWNKKVIATSAEMKQINPKYTLREWFLVSAYKQANQGDYTLIQELQEVMNNPYDEQSKEIEAKYYKKKPFELFDIAGVSHVSCSS